MFANQINKKIKLALITSTVMLCGVYLAYFFYILILGSAGVSSSGRAMTHIGQAVVETMAPQSKKFTYGAFNIPKGDRCSFWTFELLWRNCFAGALVIDNYSSEDNKKIDEIVEALTTAFAAPCKSNFTADAEKLRETRKKLGCSKEHLAFVFRLQIIQHHGMERLNDGREIPRNTLIRTVKIKGEI